MKKRDTSSFRSCSDTIRLPKYVSIRRRKGVRYIIIDHPKCKYKYFGVRSRIEPYASKKSLRECLQYLFILNHSDDVKQLQKQMYILKSSINKQTIALNRVADELSKLTNLLAQSLSS